MTIEELYTKLDGNYTQAKNLLMNDSMIERFVLKFLDDATFTKLKEAVNNEDIENSFLQAHTLKGVTANLSFTSLQKASSNLTEQLRPKTSVADPLLFEEVEKNYHKVIEAIKEYQAEK